MGQYNKFTYEFIFDYYKKYGCTLVSELYVNTDSKLDFICKCGKLYSSTFISFRKHRMCRKCMVIESNRLKLPNNQQRKKKKRYRERGFENEKWRHSVYQRDKYECRVCKSKFVELHAHHLNGYAYYPEQQHDLENGITLCKDCHREFHNKYGNRNNKKEQFDEWLYERKLNNVC